MIGQVFTYLINVVVLLFSKLADFEFVTNVNLLNTLIIWELIIIVIALLNKLSKGSGKQKGNNGASRNVSQNVQK